MDDRLQASAAPAASALAELAALLEAEERREVLPEVVAMAQEVRRRHGDAVQAVLFYGSCLRRSYVDDGVLDFYAIVDSYRAAYASRILALSNAALPPNVYYLEHAVGGRTLRMKYNVLSRADFAAACRPESLHAIVWARFCQPFAVVWARDDQVRSTIAADAAEAVLTMISRMLALAPQARTAEELWQAGFAATYGTELRTESDATIRSVYEAAPQRYGRVASLAMAELARRGLASGAIDGDGRIQGGLHGEAARSIARSWRRKLPVAKSLYAVRILKSALTFGEWLPYALWKLQRHTGVRIEPTERQRRHPLIWGWPVVLRLLLRQNLR
ncbi:MAG TPA: hypothetical protein VEC57_12620 [Candidatus Limnocylindrales bacterium]|nr:hypothetical protein [Candidatus Limnocylindrales bacterium]